VAVLLLVAVLFTARTDRPLRSTIADVPRPSFFLLAGEGGHPWFEVRRTSADGQETVVDTVSPPASSVGPVTEIVPGPDRTIMVVSSAPQPCESTLYRARLADNGEVVDLTPLPAGRVPAMVGGVAVSPDGRRLAYTTATCVTGMPYPLPSSDVSADLTLTVLDTADGTTRRWSTAAPAIIGDLVWARDSRTLGYTISEIGPPATRDGWRTGPTVGDLTVYALDTGAAGTELRTDRPLVRLPQADGRVDHAIMGLDGRSGWGMQSRPSEIVLFTFAEGKPIRVTSTIERDPNALQTFSFRGGAFDDVRYACLNGPDAFGRITTGPSLQNDGSSDVSRCNAATVPA
jgi:hypothetical protein